MIRNVVFDIGQVLLRYEPIQYMRGFGFSDREIIILDQLAFSSSIWRELDRGTYSFNEAVEIIIASNLSEQALIHRLFPLDWSKLFHPKEDTITLMKELKDSGYNIFILSNFSKEGYAYAEKTYSFLDIPDGKVISYQENCIKPEEEIYKILLQRFALIPTETVFFDDLPHNIEAAKHLGIHGIVFTGVDNAKICFEKLIKEN